MGDRWGRCSSLNYSRELLFDLLWENRKSIMCILIFAKDWNTICFENETGGAHDNWHIVPNRTLQKDEIPKHKKHYKSRPTMCTGSTDGLSSFSSLDLPLNCYTYPLRATRPHSSLRVYLAFYATRGSLSSLMGIPFVVDTSFIIIYGQRW